MDSTKNWCYTLNNPTDAQVNQLKAFTVSRHRSCLEIADSGTKHLQGHIVWKRSYRLTQLKKLIPEAHWEKTKTVDAENYCTKGEIIIDVQPAQGKRTDVSKVVERVKNGDSLQSIASENPNDFIRLHKGITALKVALQPRITTFVKSHVEVLYGKPGTGKTRKVYENDSVYSVMKPQKNGNIWFDNYDGQDVLLIDDFEGWIEYTFLLHLLDGYPLQLPIKGGTLHRNWTKVYITSNKSIWEWYEHSIDALVRRIDKVFRYEKNNVIKEIEIHIKEKDASSKKTTESEETTPCEDV